MQSHDAEYRESGAGWAAKPATTTPEAPLTDQSDLRQRIAVALERQDVIWGYDAGFSRNLANDDKTGAFVDAILAVVQPEVDRLRAERDQARAQVAAVLALQDIGPDALELMDPEQYHQAIGYNDGLAASTHAINDLAAGES